MPPPRRARAEGRGPIETTSPLVRPPEAAPGGDLAPRYRAVRALTERLTAPLSGEDCALQSMPDASPAKWHLAHTTWFFETFVLAGRPGHRPYHPRYGYLFNSYYNAVGERHPRPRRGLLSRPSLAEVLDYRRHVDTGVLDLLAGGSIPESTLAALETGLNHEQQHQELILMDVKHLLAQNPLRPAYLAEEPASFAAQEGPPAASGWVRVEEGLREIGCGGRGFAFDNEGPRHRSFVGAFEIAARVVLNGEWLTFVEDGGYERPDLWLSDGWDAVRAGEWRAPLYWERSEDGAWTEFTLHGVRPLRSGEPVCHVSYYEADAFARWWGARLPAEEEWETAARAAPLDGPFLEDGRLHPPAPAAGADRPHGLLGGVWEWTRSAYGPYPGYAPPAGALGEYNGKFMCNQMVLRGGSFATPRDHIRPTYRNFFYPSSRWPFAGLRLARDAS